MNEHDARQAVERFEQSIRRAQDLLAAADEARAQAGFGSRQEVQDFLERQLSAQEIEDVNDEVEQEVRRIQDEIALNHIPSTELRKTAAGKRHFRRMI